VQKFTRPLTREITLADERLALTFTEEGVSVRPVGSRKPPREISWGAFLLMLAAGPSAEPSPDQLAAAVQAVKGGARPAPRATPAPDTHTEAPTAPPNPGENPSPKADAPPHQGTGLTVLLGRLDRWLAEHRGGYREGLNHGADDARLHALQNALGVPLPDDLRKFLAWRNGQDEEGTGRFEESWFLMGTDDIEAAWRELTGNAESGWQRAWIPFLEDGRGNFIFGDTRQPGAPVRVYREQDPERPVLAPSLAAWLEQFVTAVEHGEYVEDPERGLFMRRRHG
jgi:cell wall assembly regulator SMI1